MKIAFWNPTPMTNGIATWLWECRKGMTQLGVECDIVLNSRSGRVLKPWSTSNLMAKVTKNIRDDELTEVLSGYDLVILAEARYLQMDKVKEGLPWYLERLRSLATKYSVVVHGPHYSHGPFMNDLVSSANYAGFLFATSANWIDFSLKTRIVELPYLPYEFTEQASPFPPKERTKAMMSSRVVSGKGQRAMTIVANSLHRDFELYGEAASLGAGGTYSALLYNKLIEQSGITPVKPLQGMGGHPWEVRNQHGFRFTFYGYYSNEDFSIYDEALINLSLTHAKMVDQHLEYATLEAIQAGVPNIVVPSCQVPDERAYPGLVQLREFDSSSNFNYHELVDAINQPKAKDSKELFASAKQFHEPRQVARKMLDRIYA